jgi:hypothetical protein
VRCPASSNAATACRAKFVSPISKNDFDSPMGVRVRAGLPGADALRGQHISPARRPHERLVDR